MVKLLSGLLSPVNSHCRREEKGGVSSPVFVYE